MITQNFRYRIYPNKKQIKKLNKTLSDCCFVYNQLLENKKDAYKKNKTNLSQFDMNRIVKGFDVDVHSQVLQNISKRINDAFKHYFRRLREKKNGKHIKVGFPRFKTLNRYKSITYPQSGFRFVSDRKLFISRIGSVPIVLHRVPRGKVKTLTVKRTSIGWFAIFSCEDVPVEEIKNVKGHVGVDVGVKSFAVFSDGTMIGNPKFLRKSEKKLRKLQRRLSRKKKGSKNRIKAKIKLGRCHERIFNQRQDFLHKTSNDVIRKYKFISVEKLSIKNMVRNHHLAKSICDVSWGDFVSMLDYKVVKTGGQVIKVNPKNTSKTCSQCGHVQDMPLSKRVFECENCGMVLDRDVNAASAPFSDGVSSVVESGTIYKPLRNHR